MDTLVWTTIDNSTDALKNAHSDGVAVNYSTAALPTTSRSLAGQSLSVQIVAIVSLAVCSIGICANAVVLLVLVRARRHFGSSVHTLIANQSAMDLYTCVFAMVSVAMLAGGYKYNGNGIRDNTICVIFEDDA